MVLSEGDSKFLVNHVFLPPSLPNADDEDRGASALLKQVILAAYDFSTRLTTDERATWDRIIESLQKWDELHDDGNLCEDRIQTTLLKLRTDGDVSKYPSCSFTSNATTESLLLFLKAQNAAILVQKKAKGFLLECFEVSATTQAVLEAKDTLIRMFPARSIFLNDKDVRQNSFITELSSYLHKLSIESTTQSLESITKAGQTVRESRQTEHPRLVTEWLFGFLAGKGKQIGSSKPITKRTRDEICWDNALKPWRRSPLWFCIKIALQLSLQHHFDNSDNYYKNFMLFQLCYFARGVQNAEPPLSFLHVIRVKLARRFAKLSSRCLLFPGLHGFFEKTMAVINSHMNGQWSHVTQQENVNLPTISGKNIQSGTSLSLQHTMPVLEKILARYKRSQPHGLSVFRPEPSIAYELPAEKLPKPSIFSVVQQEMRLEIVVTFHDWVGQHLQAWERDAVADHGHCSELHELMKRYYLTACSVFSGHPEYMSLVLLVLFELWVVLDKMTLQLYPLMSNYSPELPQGLFIHLVLPKASELRRLCEIERYLSMRYENQNKANPSIFGRLSYQSFAVQQFDNCPKLQTLNERVDQAWEERKEDLRQRFRKLKEHHDDLITQSLQIPQCSKYFYTRGALIGRWRHDNKCRKCELRSKASKLKIQRIEQPLPSNEIERKAVVFELQPGQAFIAWRDATQMIIQDVLRGSSKAGNAVKTKLSDYQPLSEFYLDRDRRVGLASHHKSFLQAHYIEADLSSTLDDTLFLGHALKHQLHDSCHINLWIEEQDNELSLSKYCRPKVPEGPYVTLTETVQTPHHSQNGVIARQCKCPVGIGTHEFIAFGSMRAGEGIQWMNLLRCLYSDDVDFNAPATFVLVEQLAHQAGSQAADMTDMYRHSHQDLKDTRFCETLLRGIQNRLNRIKTNWRETNAASLLLSIILRLISLTSDNEVLRQGLEMLRVIRRTALIWVQQMATLHNDMRTKNAQTSSLKEIQRRVLNAALLTRATWDLDNRYRPALLASQADLADYVACSVFISNYRDFFKDDRDRALRLILLKDTVLATALCPQLQNLLATCQVNEGITDGIKTFWPAAKIQSQWCAVNCEKDKWLGSLTVEDNKHVHYHLETGQLLVAGSPLSVLPHEYTKFPLYEQVMGTTVHDVVAADTPDMDFMTTASFHGHFVYFAIRDGELVIRSRCQGRVYEAILRVCFSNHMPTLLLSGTLPWFDLHHGIIEFRAKKQPWLFDNSMWALQLGQAALMYRGSENKQYLIDYDSLQGKNIVRIFENFEHKNFLEMRWSSENGLAVELPRYHLTFSLDKAEGHFHCLELNAYVSTNPIINTLHGLSTRLVLSTATNSSIDQKKLVLIPYGTLSVEKTQFHVRIKIETGSGDSVTFFRYKIDETLQQLNAGGHLEAHLFKSYLHAVTSSCVRDELTGRTGAEEALATLSDTITLSSVPMSKRAMDILENIGKLTPVLSYYPDKETRMLQSVKRDQKIPFLSQRYVFYEKAQQISDHNIQAHFLFESEKHCLSDYGGDDDLRERAKRYAERFYQATNWTQDSSHAFDQLYRCRDRTISEQSRVAYRMSVLILKWPMSFPVLTDTYALVEYLGALQGFGEDFTSNSLSDLLNLKMKTKFASMMAYCVDMKSSDKISLALLFSLIAFGNPDLVSILQTLAAFAISESLKSISLPEDLGYDIPVGRTIDHARIQQITKQCQEPIVLRGFRVYGQTSKNNDEVEEYNEEVTYQNALIIRDTLNSWPGNAVDLPSADGLSHFRYEELQQMLNETFEGCYRNHLLSQHLALYDEVLRGIDGEYHWSQMPSLIIGHPLGVRCTELTTYPTLLSLLQQSDDSLLAQNPPRVTDFDCKLRFAETNTLETVDERMNETVAASQELECLLQELRTENHPTRNLVAESLKNSVTAYNGAISRNANRSRNGKITTPDKGALLHMYHKARETMLEFQKFIERMIAPKSPAQKSLLDANIWPKPTPASILQLLNFQTRQDLPPRTRTLLITFASTVTALQRVARLIHMTEIQDAFSLDKELENLAHSAWNINSQPDWILLEIQNDMLIRPVQIQVAEEIMRHGNGVVQLGMGEGKTSVILPMVISALSNGATFVRVVVLKSLANEMLQGLAANLSGLVNRPLFYLPFSRSTALSKKNLSILRMVWQKCKVSQGVLLALPEHINSFRLIGNDKHASGQYDIAKQLLQAQKWLDRSVIDVQDESDEILNPRNELVYTSGLQNALSGAPDRWLTIIDVLSLVQNRAEEALQHQARGIEYKNLWTNSFPVVRLLNDAGADCLINMVLIDIKNGRLPQLPLLNQPEEVLCAVVELISGLRVSRSAQILISKLSLNRTQQNCLYLLRGMFAFGHLSACLQKRWSVNYGLDRSRCLSAVPYRARLTPAAAAEFAQPDVMVLLTCLSYYYTGLEAEDLKQCISLLLKSPDPAEEYSKWSANAGVPEAYHSVESLNLESDACIEQLHPYFRMNKHTIDFFLKRIVFPKEAKEFTHKLSTSAWDLCSGSGRRFVSGFSGTCDILLPIGMPKTDLAGLRHYDAAVLIDLLKSRNRKYICAEDGSHQPLSTKDLLYRLRELDPPPSVIIDVGAQILDVNKDVASQWLKTAHDKMACIFFNDNDEKTVVARDGRVELLASSPFKEQMSKCLIFLDQFHTRGTDFQLPDDFKAVVLIGPNLQKDEWVQACMRMRKLSSSQAITFIAPPEVDNSIRSLLGISAGTQITSAHLVAWTIRQSCQAIDNQRFLWIERGLAFKKRDLAFGKHVEEQGRVKNTTAYLSAVQEADNLKVTHLYPVFDNKTRQPPYAFSKFEKADEDVQRLLTEWDAANNLERFCSSRQEEQEREILHEVEQEREIERPDHVNARKPQINTELLSIIQHERVVHVMPESVLPAFDILKKTSIAARYFQAQWPNNVYATEDFLYPVKVAEDNTIDEYMRPVNWLLKLANLRSPIIISPHEAEAYLPDIRRSNVAKLILYSPRTTKGMYSFDAMDILSIPRAVSVVDFDLNSLVCLRLFAGQLYFNTYNEYIQFCQLLGLWDGKRVLVGANGGRVIADDLFVKPDVRTKNKWASKWKHSPVELMKEWIEMRRQGVEWSHTHIGRILHGQTLTERDFA